MKKQENKSKVQLKDIILDNPEAKVRINIKNADEVVKGIDSTKTFKSLRVLVYPF